MKAISKLKDDARRHELKEEWDKAVHVYLQVLRVGEEGEGEVELPLYNRVGDLYVRLGRPDQAVTYYEQAADRYAEAGLYNNAIALCNKALRYDPDRPELLRKLGQFSASQGFLTDARRYFLQFAEQKFAVGAVTEALAALEDFANVADDPEIREMLGRQLHTTGRHDEAVQELRRAHAGYISAGEVDRATAVLDTMRGIDPAAAADTAAGATPVFPSQRPHAQERDTGPALSDFQFGSPTHHRAEDPLPTLDFSSPVEGLEPTQFAEEVNEEDVGPEDLPGLDPAADDDSDFSMLEGLESTSLDFGAAAAGIDPADFGLELERDETSFDDATLDPDPPAETPHKGALDLPGLDDDLAELDLSGVYHAVADETGLDDEDDLGVFELPTLDVGEDDAGPVLPTIDQDDEDYGTYELPALDDDAEAPAFELPEIGDDDDLLQGWSFELPLLADDPWDDADAGFTSLPMLDEPVADDDLPALDESAEDEDVAWPTAIGPAAADGTLADGNDLSVMEPEAPEDERARAASFDDVDDGATDDWATDVAEALAEGVDEVDTGFGWPAAHADLADAADVETHAADSDDVSAIDTAAEVEAAEDAQAEMAQGWTPDELLYDEPAADSTGASAPPATPAAEGPGPAADRALPPDNDFIDLGALLAEDSPESTRFRVQETVPTGDEDQDFAELLSQFKAKVSEHLPAEDAAAHYDLGLAFKEMGLIDEAISEFQIAMRAGNMRLKVYEELGDCFLQKQQFNIAEKVLRRGLDMKYDDELELLGVYYFLGRAYEGMGRSDQARDAYERVLGMDINFQDVSERLARL
jgi:tetratricopeptide (TPR) repeat protein